MLATDRSTHLSRCHFNETFVDAIRSNSFPLPVQPLTSRVRFLLGGRHGEFRFLPPPGFAPCSEAMLPRGPKLKVEPCQRYTLDPQDGGRELLGPTVALVPPTFTPAPVDISKVRMVTLNPRRF